MFKLARAQMPHMSPEPASDDSRSKQTDTSTAKLSGLDTLSLAATAALDERGDLAARPAPAPGNYKTASGSRKKSESSTTSSGKSDGGPSGGTHSVSTSPDTDGAPNRSPLTLLSDEAALSSTAARPHRLRAAAGTAQGTAQRRSDSDAWQELSTSQTSQTSQTPSPTPPAPAQLPTLTAMFPAQAGGSPAAQQPADHSNHRWTYQNHSSTLAPDQAAQPAIHPQLAAMGDQADAGAAGGGGPGLTRSPMSIASLTTPMYRHPMLLPNQGPALTWSSDPATLGNSSTTTTTTTTSAGGLKRQFIDDGPAPAGGGASRKKRQCSQCQGWFSNLATHRSTHLTDTSRPHTCHVCSRGFARPNDLFRHMKSHRGEAPFRCPFFFVAEDSSTTSTTTPKATSTGTNTGTRTSEPACHQTGGFSRCDTYKNHLKAMHFEYPPGTKKKERAGMRGACKGCGLGFESSEVWIARHVEVGECEGLKTSTALSASASASASTSASAESAAGVGGEDGETGL